MDSKIIKAFAVESLAWLVVALTAMFLIQPLWTTSALERPDRQPAPMILAVGFGLAASYLRGQLFQSRGTLRAKRLVLEDNAGRDRVYLDAGGEFPTLMFSSAAGFPHVTLLGDENPSLLMFGGSDLRSSTHLMVSDDGPNIALKHGQASVGLSAAADGPSLSLECDLAKVRLSADAGDGASLCFHNGEGIPVVMLDPELLSMSGPHGACGFLLAESGPALLLQDAAGNRVHPIPVKTEKDNGIRGFAPDKR